MSKHRGVLEPGCQEYTLEGKRGVLVPDANVIKISFNQKIATEERTAKCKSDDPMMLAGQLETTQKDMQNNFLSGPYNRE